MSFIIAHETFTGWSTKVKMIYSITVSFEFGY